MYANNTMRPVCDSSLSSQEEIENAIALIEKESQGKISEIFYSKYHIATVGEASLHLNIGHLLKDVYVNCHPSPASHRVVEEIASYKKLLGDTITYFTEVTVPLFVCAFRCHREALTFYSSLKKEQTRAAMAATGKLAENIEETSVNLGESFHKLIDKQIQILTALTETKNQANLTSIHDAMRSVGEILEALSKEADFWKTYAVVCCVDLKEAHLGNRDNIELCESEPGSKKRKDFEALCAKYSDYFDMLDRQNKEGASMKTGGAHLTEKPTSMSDFGPQNMPQAFEYSYIKWLALAKIHITMAKAIISAKSALEEYCYDILSFKY